MATNAGHVVDHGLPGVFDRQPIDKLIFRRARPFADISKSLRAELGCLEAVRQQAAHQFVAKEFHAAIGVVNDEPLARAEQLVRDHQRADGIVAGAAAGVADYVCVAFAQSGVPGGIEPRVHAGENREMARGRERELTLRSERAGIASVGGENFIQYGRHKLSFLR